MKLLANENFPLASTLLLRQAGYDITAIGTDNSSISDPQVIAIADQEARTILTFDSDYGTLIYKYGYTPKAGVIYLRLFDFTPEYPGQYLKTIFETGNLKFNRKLTVIDSQKIRQRKY